MRLAARERASSHGRGVAFQRDPNSDHKHEQVELWLSKHPGFPLHFIPTSNSWLTLVERWFRDLDDKAIRRGVFHSVPNLIAAIEGHLNANNDKPSAFVWTATADEILVKVRRGRLALQGIPT